MDSDSVPRSPSWEIEVVVWSPDKTWNGHAGFTGLVMLLGERARQGWQFVTVVNDVPDSGPCWVFQRPVAGD
jgi:hypothetical protein